MSDDLDYKVGQTVKYENLIMEGKWDRVVISMGEIIDINYVDQMALIYDEWIPFSCIIRRM